MIASTGPRRVPSLREAIRDRQIACNGQTGRFRRRSGRRKRAVGLDPGCGGSVSIVLAGFAPSPLREGVRKRRRRRDWGGMPRVPYPTDLCDAEWTILEPLLPLPKSRGRRRADLRAVVNAIRYVTRSGAQWRMVPRDLVPWGTAWSYFRRWRDDGTWQQLHARLASGCPSGRRSRSAPIRRHPGQPVRQDGRARRCRSGVARAAMQHRRHPARVGRVEHRRRRMNAGFGAACLGRRAETPAQDSSTPKPPQSCSRPSTGEMYRLARRSGSRSPWRSQGPSSEDGARLILSTGGRVLELGER